MDDVISRQAAIEALAEWHDEAITNRLNNLPSAQKKGHWIDEGTNYSCSECHRGCWVNSNYCPWCGARMDGKDNDNGTD